MNIKVYHGSTVEVKKPDVTYGRFDIDFGQGFYVTQNKEMAYKWAARKNSSVVSEYNLNTDELRSITLKADKQWLDFVAANRGYSKTKYDVSQLDLIIGPVADDNLYGTMENYFDGSIDAETTVKILNVMDYSEQIVLKTQKAQECIEFVKAIELTPEEIEHYRNMAKKEKLEFISKIAEIKNIAKSFIEEKEIVLQPDELQTDKDNESIEEDDYDEL